MIRPTIPLLRYAHVPFPISIEFVPTPAVRVDLFDVELWELVEPLVWLGTSVSSWSWLYVAQLARFSLL